MRRRQSNPAAKRALAWLAVLVLCLCMPQLWILCRSHDGDVQLELRGAAASCSHHDHAEPATHRHEAADADHDPFPGNAGLPSCEHSELLLDTPPLPRPERTAAPRAEPNAWASYLLALADGNHPVDASRNAAGPPPLPPDRQQRRALTTTRLLV